MSLIQKTFEKLAKSGKKALVPYITAGDPDPALTVSIMHTLVTNGADIIELGIPFSDPMADGPVIQLACERALKHKVSLKKVLSLVKNFRLQNTETPVVLMGYLNPVERMGYAEFVKQAALAGVDAVLLVDMPVNESGVLATLLSQHNMDSIFLIAPTTSEERIKAITALSGGYVYYVSVRGVTGSAQLNLTEVRAQVNLIQSYSQVPVCVGFGIKDAESAKNVAQCADGVIVGSALVNILDQWQHDPETMDLKLSKLMSSMRKALDELSV